MELITCNRAAAIGGRAPPQEGESAPLAGERRGLKRLRRSLHDDEALLPDKDSMPLPKLRSHRTGRRQPDTALEDDEPLYSTDTAPSSMPAHPCMHAHMQHCHGRRQFELGYAWKLVCMDQRDRMVQSWH